MNCLSIAAHRQVENNDKVTKYDTFSTAAQSKAGRRKAKDSSPVSNNSSCLPIKSSSVLKAVPPILTDDSPAPERDSLSHPIELEVLEANVKYRTWTNECPHNVALHLRRMKEKDSLIEWINVRRPKEFEVVRKLTRCGEGVVFRQYGDQWRRTEGRYCNFFDLCPVCSIRRSSRRAYRYSERHFSLLPSCADFSWSWIAFTNGYVDDLRDGVRRLIASFSELMRRGRRHRKLGKYPTFAEAGKIVAALRFVEVSCFLKQNSMGRYYSRLSKQSWIPHIHAIVGSSDSLSHRDLRAEWITLVGDEGDVSFGRPFDFNNVKRTSDLITGPANGFSKAIRYAGKHSSNKDSVLPDVERNAIGLHAVRWYVFDELRRKEPQLRLFEPYGLLRGQVNETKLDQLAEDTAISDDSPTGPALTVRVLEDRTYRVVEIAS